jgi:exopolyphosphatase / guanosine-5'-triphosphate,3'-diphosphate pyrophosphatase
MEAPADRQSRGEILAAIDLGTNNCRLLIAASENGNLRVVDSFSRIVRLGERMALTGVLSDEAMDRTIAALRICAERIARHPCLRVRAVATAACRRASNAATLVDRAIQEAGITLDVVTAREEARLAALGCAPLIGARYDGALVFDIGGGSTEAIWLKRSPTREHGKAGKPKLVHFCSVPVGVMTLAETEGKCRYADMVAHMLERFAAVRREMDAFGPFDADRYHLLGTSGTVTTLAGIALKLSRYVRARVDGTWHDCAAMHDLVERLTAMDRPARVLLGCVGEERADLILPGCAIYNAIQTLWPCAKLRVADRGLREGILRDLMKDAKH